MSDAIHAARSHEDQATAWSNEAGAFFILLVFLLAGALALLPVTRDLLRLWSTDPLRSFGALVPLASCSLTVRAWRSLQFRWRGSAWGLVPVAVAIVLARVADGAVLALRWNGTGFNPLQPGLVLFLYFSGVLLLIGGRVLWRAALFPLCLLLCVDPVPHLFTAWVDLPLQTASAGVARAFAHSLGLFPTGEQLRLMFTPRFGMLIVPGCNGLRGSATMAYGVLLIGYLRGYRRTRLALAVAAAAAVGYLLNLLRLCVLVLYYWAGVHAPRLQANGALVDYMIGGTLFLLVGVLAGAVWLGGSPQPRPIPLGPQPWHLLLRTRRMEAVGFMLVLAALTEAPAAWTLLREPAGRLDIGTVQAALPQTAGPWTRQAVATEDDGGGPIWLWTTYRAPDGRAVDLGVWLSPLQHFAAVSRQVQGLVPEWTGSFDAEGRGGLPMTMSAFTLTDDLHAVPVPTFFAETTCLASRCGVRAVGMKERGFSLVTAPITAASPRHLSLLVRVRHDRPVNEAMRDADERTTRELMREMDVRGLTRTLGRF